MTATDTRESAQNRSGATIVQSVTCQTYTMMNHGTNDMARMRITESYRPMSATVEAWPNHLTHDEAEQYGTLASATLTMQDGDSITSYTQRIYEQAAILGMDTLRELARPLLRDVPTAGES